MHTDPSHSGPLTSGGATPVAVDQGMAARLRWARESANFATAADAIRVHEWTGTYNQHENGIRGFLKHVRKYARAYRVREDWLRYGQGLPRANMRGIVVGGIVGQFGIITESETAKMPRDEQITVEEPPGEAADYTAYKVAGDLNYPALFDGDLIYAASAVTPDLVIGKQCVATLGDGTKRICILAPGSIAGLFLLLSVNASPIPDIEVIEAAPIVWIKRG